MSQFYKARVRTNPDPISSFDIFEAQLRVDDILYRGYGESPDDALIDLQSAVIQNLPGGGDLDIELPAGLDAPLAPDYNQGVPVKGDGATYRLTATYGGIEGYVAEAKQDARDQLGIELRTEDLVAEETLELQLQLSRADADHGWTVASKMTDRAEKAERVANEALELAHKHYVASLPARLLLESISDVGKAFAEAFSL